jgi:hypothetical protein
MTSDAKPDMSCVPYRRKGLYFALTIPFLLLLLVVFIYLATVGLFVALAFLLLYLAMSYFQAYCCAHQDCPYVGGFCPAVIGILPANLLAKLLYDGRPLVRSKKRFEVNATLGVLSWLGLILLPLFWLARLGIGFAIGYFVCHAVYAAVFGLTICPVCAIRNTCPGGSFHRLFAREEGGP